MTRYGRRDTVEIAVIDSIWYGAFGNTEGRTVLVRDPGAQRVLAIFTTDTDQRHRDRGRPLRRPLADRDRHRRRQTTARHRPGPQPAAARGGAHRAVRASASTASSSSGTRCTATTPTTSPAAAPISPGTRTRTTSPSKTCSPSSAEALSQHELRALTQLSPTPANTATTNWPAPQPPRNCESQVTWINGVDLRYGSTADQGRTGREDSSSRLWRPARALGTHAKRGPSTGHSAVGLRQAGKFLLTPRPHFTAPSCTPGNQVVDASDGPPFRQERRPTRVCRTPGAGSGLLAEASTLRAG